MAQAKKSPKRAASVPVKRKPNKSRVTKPAVAPPRAGKTQSTVPKRQKKAAIPKPKPKIVVRPVLAQVMATIAHAKWFGRIFAALAVLVLIATTVYWGILSARLQRINADQLIDSYLFQDKKTFQQAIFPGQHSFLLKWPLFWVSALFSYSRDAFLAVTVGLVLVTVLALAATMQRILRGRPLLFGSVCLALAGVLLLVPAQPAAGALLPVNMAMTTTRNIEYVFFLASIYAFIRSRRWRDGWFALGLVLALLLIASDKLFAPLFIGGAICGLSAQIWTRRQRPTSVNWRWLSGGILAAVAASALLKLITRLRFTTIANGATNSPYPMVHSVKQLAEGIVFGVGSLFTNFGANPVHSTVIIRDIPLALWHSLSYATVTYAINALVLLGGLFATGKLWARYYRHDTDDIATRFALALSFTSVAAVAVYVLTDHYYPVDARYITITLFAQFIAAAVYLREVRLRHRHVLAAASLLVIGIGFGLFAAQHEYQQSKAALHNRGELTGYVATKVDQNNVGTLIGNYWYVTPVRLRVKAPLTIVPMITCLQANSVLLSTAWLQAPRYKAVAYLAVRDSGQNTYGGCTLAQLKAQFGIPTQQFVVSGSSSQPNEVLLLYPGGVNRVLHGRRPPAIKPVAVAPFPQLNDTSLNTTNKCVTGATLTVVAHEDDDLLFMNPYLQHAIHDGRCITTVYLTAGDSGEGNQYGISRQLGVEAAYSFMYGVPDVWRQQLVTVAGHQLIAEYLQGQPAVNLIFFNLPDGNLDGTGYAVTHSETLAKLRVGRTVTIHSIDGAAAYTSQELIATLTDLMEIYQPDVVHTQDYNSNQNDGDHSDHHAAGYFTKKAYAAYSRPSVLQVYAGYPGRFYAVNVFGQDALDKTATFLQYAPHDPAVCQTELGCQQSPTYGNYLSHQYFKLVNAHVQPE